MEPRDYEALFSRYKTRGILLDTNLLLVLLTGLVDERLIGKRERTKDYSSDDYLYLTGVLEPFHKRYFTPHILTETLGLGSFHGRDRMFKYFEASQALCQHFCEQVLLFTDILAASQDLYCRLGLTDAGIVLLAKQKELLTMTNDKPLAQELRAQGCAVIHYATMKQVLSSHSAR